ncbi:hypothetical protein GCM10028791_16380 [Echinicola sediminis]
MKKVALSKYRELKTLRHNYDLVVIGGGLSGSCAAITAAREGIKVALIQDRPVLGGNASSEVRLWALGATSHMGNNNRWAREGGLINEIILDNTYRNKEGNPVIFDTVLLDKVLKEDTLDLYLNTSVFSVIKYDDQNIKTVVGFNSQNSTLYEFEGKQFIDASGDGIIAYQAGVPYRIGAESPEEFEEAMSPDVEDYGELLGHTLFFYSKKQEEPVQYTAPNYALKDMSAIPRIKNVKVGEDGCKLWWFEYGGRKDTVHDTEEIKLELWKVAYGIWNHIKNSGEYDGADHYTLEWVGLIPGKRESRRFEGHYMIHQKDLVEQRQHYDAISFGGWAMDLHPADGIYSDKSGCNQWHTKGVYQIPYRCYVPQGIDNLLLAGRIISASHVAFGSTRVMVTCAHGGQAVGMAAALSVKKGLSPKEFMEEGKIGQLQATLMAQGHYIPQFKLNHGYNLAEQAHITPSSTLELKALPHSGDWESLGFSMAQMVPIQREVPNIQLKVKAEKETVLEAQLRISSKVYNHTPDIPLETFRFELQKGEQEITLKSDQLVEGPQYLFACLMKNDLVSVGLTDKMVSGLVTVYNSVNKAVSNFGKQDPPKEIGVDAFEFWCPKRRPKGKNMAFSLDRSVQLFGTDNLINGTFRPVEQPNAWVADLDATVAVVKLTWKQPQKIHTISLFFDSDYDHPMETVQMKHAESIMPFCVRNFKLYNCGQHLIAEVKDNYQALYELTLEEPLVTDSIVIQMDRPNENTPISLMGILCR